MERIEKGYQIWIERLIAALVFLVPLVIFPLSQDAFALPKLMVARVFIFCLIILWIKGEVRRNGLRGLSRGFFSSPLDVPVWTFVGVSLLATIFSTNSGLSWRGMYYFYFEGLQTIILYWMVYLVVKNNVGKTGQEVVIKAILIGSGFVGVYAIIQRLGFDPLPWLSSPQPRVWSTLGNPNFLGAYLAMVIPLALDRVTELRRTRWQKLYLIALLGVLLFALAFSASRAAFVALFVALIVWVVLKAKTQGNFRCWILMVVAVSLFVILAGRLVEKESQPGPVTRMASLANWKEPNIASRLSGWKVALVMVEKRPLLGYGLDTFGLHFRRFMPDGYEQLTMQNANPAYAHNELLQKAATTGFLGAGIYLWLIISVVWVGFRTAHRAKVPGLLAASVAFIVQNQFGFGMITCSVLFWLILGLLGQERSKK